MVEKVETKTKNHLYRLEERFFNIWYLMRFGRKTHQRVLWLVRFFETMFGGDPNGCRNVSTTISGHRIRNIGPRSGFVFDYCLCGIVKDEEMEDLLKKKTRVYLLNVGQGRMAEEIGTISV